MTTRLIFTASLLLFTSLTVASNLNFLHDITPISDFTKEDSKQFWDTVNTALDTKKDGEKVAWKNQKSGNSGLVNPLTSYEEDKTACRDVRIINRSKKNIAESMYKFCKKDGKWIVIHQINE